MFGYVVPNQTLLGETEKSDYRKMYCGLCHCLRERHGLFGTATLSNDLTFLAVLHSALYEPRQEECVGRCTAHPFRAQRFVKTEYLDYVADMNLALAYHKCRDNWQDDKDPISGAEGIVLRHSYKRVKHDHPEQCAAIESWLSDIHEIEERNDGQIDPPVNSTGKMLGTLFVRDPNDFWSDSLYRIGDGIGRFIYLMDAYDDLDRDIRRGSFNPLRNSHSRPDYEAFINDALTMAIADSTEAFEELPILRYVEILRNILYSGVWTRYAAILKKRKDKSKE